MFGTSIEVQHDNNAPIIIGENNQLITIIQQAFGEDVKKELVEILTFQIVNYFKSIDVKLDNLADEKGLRDYLFGQIQEALKNNRLLLEQLKESQGEIEKNKAYIIKMEQNTTDTDYQSILQKAKEALDNYDSEKYQSVLKTFQENKRFQEEVKNQANSHYLRATDYIRNGNYKDAQAQLEIAVRYDPDNGYYLLHYGNTFHHLCQYQEALLNFEKALLFFQAIDDKEGSGETLNNIALISMAKGDLYEALEYFEQSLEIAIAFGDKLGEGITLSNIGLIYHEIGYHIQALVYFRQSLEIAVTVGNKHGEGTALNNIGLIYQKKGDRSKALVYFERSLKISVIIGNKLDEIATLANIGLIYQVQGDLQTALKYFERSLKISQAIGDQSGEGMTFLEMGYIYWKNNDFKEVIKNWTNAYSIAKKIEYAKLLNTLEKLAKTKFGQEDGLAFWESLSVHPDSIAY